MKKSPLWIVLEKEIARMKAGARLPPASRLSERFSVSIKTITRILGTLEKKGMVVRIPGKGSFAGSIHDLHEGKEDYFTTRCKAGSSQEINDRIGRDGRPLFSGFEKKNSTC